MRLWAEAQLAALTTAAARARSGEPTVLLISGDAGSGKSSLLDELAARSRDFTTLAADGLEADHTPYGLIEQLDAVPARDGARIPTFLSVAKAVRDRLDALAVAGPVLIRLDDLHWADPESVDVLTWVLRRTAGDRLLVAAATRDSAAGRFRTWDSWTDDSSRTVRLALRGLSAAAAQTLVQRRWPAATPDLALRLWRHTSGNPLYLNSLLDEHEPAELDAAEVLPPPLAFARSIGRRTERSTPAARGLMSGAAVLGSDWSALLDACAVGGVEPRSSAAAAQELVDADMVRIRNTGAGTEIRISHALVRSAVYAQLSLPVRQELHARAAQVVTGEATVLRHLIGAADQYDLGLAARVEAFAARCYAAGSFREAAAALRASSRLTPDPAGRERRWLESLLCSVMARDFETVHAARDDVLAASSQIGRALVLASLAVAQRRHHDAVALLEPVAALPVDAVDPLSRYRVEVELAWSRICIGYDTATVRDGLARAEAVNMHDPGLSGLETVARGQVAVRRDGADAVLAALAGVPEQATAVPLPATPALAWRGTLRASTGLTRDAVADLREVARRIEDGVLDLGAGSFHAFLGMSQWLDGDWPGARITMRKAIDITGVFEHPMVLALVPLTDVSEGRFAEAAPVLARVRDDLLRSPWPEACRLLLVTLVVRAHAAGSAAEQATLVPDLRGTALQPPPVDQASPLLLLHLTQAWIWAGDLDLAGAAVARLPQVRPRPSWVPAATAWLAGLVATAHGATDAADTHFAEARSTSGFDLPLYRAHLLTDAARLAGTRDRTHAVEHWRRAEEIYRRLGAVPYQARAQDALRALAVDVCGPQAAGRAGRPTLSAPLTERERDVMSLVVSGLSYAQIARELFVTQSTVGYHLGNIYDKAGVRSRHGLTELAHRYPDLLTTANSS